MPALTGTPVLNYRLQDPSIFQADTEGHNFPPEDSSPFQIVIFDEELPLGSNPTDENRYVTPRELWLTGVVASAPSATQPAFQFQLMQIVTDPDTGDQSVTLLQEKPTNNNSLFGTAQQQFYFTRPIYIPPGTEIVCQVTNLNADGVIQIVLNCANRDLPGDN